MEVNDDTQREQPDQIEELIADEDLALDDNEMELLWQNFKLDHMSFAKLHRMTRGGDLPSRLAKSWVIQFV